MAIDYRQFACPQIPGDEQTPTLIAVTHGQGAVAMLLERARNVIPQRAQGLEESLSAWLLSTSDFETTWDVSFGRVVRALESDAVDAVDVLAEVALRLAAMGHPARWTVTLRERRRLCWAGCWLLPTASKISVHSNGTIATVELTDPAGAPWATTFRRDDGGWTAAEVERLVQVGARRPITLLSSEAVPQDMVVEDDFHSIFDFPPITPDTARSFSAAVDIVREHTPEYLDWIEGVLRNVLICRCQESRTRSSSWMHAPGIILVSSSTNPIEIAEMLVHESSHQYYYLVSRLGDAVQGGDMQEYYSPAVQRKRPLSKILVGYHAFANILLFYRTLLRQGLAGDAYCVSMEARLSAEVDELEQPLRDNPALTRIGLDLCQPLIEQLSGDRLMA